MAGNPDRQATSSKGATMRKVILAAAIVVAAPAHAMTYYLVADWYENGNHFCRYSNGTVLNVGVRICPLKIEG